MEPGYQTPSGGGLAMGEHPVSCQSAACLLHACGSNFSYLPTAAVIGEPQSLTGLEG